ncbi:hypothetical protein CEXT_563861 [Caerostris extrusa]|uniref:Uncharacterized protein n=1 Tax=Caerostris extrusa TaxID=172846 RepID=A0AAV4XIM2_CAEEX|nr:hypothetical protein CEXT_563861 [Caerostris extrusa]
MLALQTTVAHVRPPPPPCSFPSFKGSRREGGVLLFITWNRHGDQLRSCSGWGVFNGVVVQFLHPGKWAHRDESGRLAYLIEWLGIIDKKWDMKMDNESFKNVRRDWENYRKTDKRREHLSNLISDSALRPTAIEKTIFTDAGSSTTAYVEDRDHTAATPSLSVLFPSSKGYRTMRNKGGVFRYLNRHGDQSRIPLFECAGGEGEGFNGVCLCNSFAPRENGPIKR